MAWDNSIPSAPLEPHWPAGSMLSGPLSHQVLTLNCLLGIWQTLHDNVYPNISKVGIATNGNLDGILLARCLTHIHQLTRTRLDKPSCGDWDSHLHHHSLWCQPAGCAHLWAGAGGAQCWLVLSGCTIWYLHKCLTVSTLWTNNICVFLECLYVTASIACLTGAVRVVSLVNQSVADAEYRLDVSVSDGCHTAQGQLLVLVEGLATTPPSTTMPTTTQATTPPEEKDGPGFPIGAVIGAVVGLLLLLLLLLLFLCWRKRSKRKMEVQQWAHCYLILCL